ncbi:MAG: hypothetical protein GX085_01390 [Firmicutes bacterium]|nr:hypothetical protein [Bacillota bacterium]
MSACAVLRRIERVSQRVADLLDRPGRLTRPVADNLIEEIETVIGGVRNLPLSKKNKRAILRHLQEAQVILRNGRLGLRAIEQLLAVVQILQLAGYKIQIKKLPCPPGKVTVFPSNRFSTICSICS